MTTLNLSLTLTLPLTPKTLQPISLFNPTTTTHTSKSKLSIASKIPNNGFLALNNSKKTSLFVIKASTDGGRSNNTDKSEERESIMLPGCDYNHWLIVMEFPKEPAPTRQQMIDTYLDTLSTVLGSMEEAKKNMYAFSTTTYTGFQCTVDEETSEKFKGLPGVLWVLPDSYIDVKNKDYGGDKYVNGEIIPCTYPTYQPKQRSSSKYENRKYERRRQGPPPEQRRPRQGASASDSTSQ